MAERCARTVDDAVEYWLFPVIDTSLSTETKRKLLVDYVDTFLAFVSCTVVDHIWQKEPFNLTAVVEKGSNLYPSM